MELRSVSEFEIKTIGGFYFGDAEGTRAYLVEGADAMKIKILADKAADVAASAEDVEDAFEAWRGAARRGDLAASREARQNYRALNSLRYCAARVVAEDEIAALISSRMIAEWTQIADADASCLHAQRLESASTATLRRIVSTLDSTAGRENWTRIGWPSFLDGLRHIAAERLQVRELRREISRRALSAQAGA